MLKAKRAVLSVYDKRDLAEFAQGLVRLGAEILSTGGTFKALEAEGIPVTAVADVTGFPEILDGRVKTLHPLVYGGILADRTRASHVAELRTHGIAPIDLVVVNLYPFREMARQGDASFNEMIEMIDIGGPGLIRAAAKNHQGVAVVVDPDDYPQVLTALEESEGLLPEGLRRRLAIKAFRHTQTYDAAVADWLERQSGDEDQLFFRHMVIDLEKEFEPRYGENPHQRAALYRTLGGPGVLGGFEQLQGGELSFNNIIDADAAQRMVADLAEPAVAIIKHCNPCGVGLGGSPLQAYQRALECDPISAFGSIVACNRAVDGGTVEAMSELFIEVLIAPEFTENARRALAARANLRVLSCPLMALRPSDIEFRSFYGGYLAQTIDSLDDDPAQWTCPTEIKPTPQEQRALEFAWKVVRHVKSNAIVVANQHQTVGFGAGQTSRVDACSLAIRNAHVEIAGSVAASDAFFPFRDGLDVLVDAGVTALVQPGGSKRDLELLAAANERKIAMLMTGIRHFRH
ncbi:MAG: bifunctional phosphoribosylaminoimidazolecarboxamide formyltransferase/IMP cyclohydrolase [Thermoanaerobaculia bacterium]